MKKLIAAILALCLCMGTASADGLGSWLRGLWESAAGSDEAAGREESEFDRLFDSGLTPVLEKEYIDVSQVPVYVSAEYARDNAESLGISPDSITEGLVFVANAGDVAGEDAKFFFPMSVSPDGSKMLAVYDSLALCYDGEKLVVLSWSRERSVQRGETEDDDLIGFLQANPYAFNRLIGSTDGVIWSPDGSKAVLLYSGSFLHMSYTYFAQLMIADMETGEAYLAYRFGESLAKDDDFGAVMGACFDESGRYIYYTVWAHPPVLRRHDTQTGEDVELQAYLENMAEFPSRPRLNMLRDGSLLTLYEGKQRGDYGLLYLYEGSAGRAFRRYETGLQPLGRIVSFDMNAQSGLGVALDQEANSDMTGRLLIPGFLLIVDTDKNMSGLSEPVLIKTDGSAVRMNKTQLMQLITDGKTEDFDYVLSVSLSPDGEYALVTGRSCMYILRLRTLETRRVEFPEGTECAQFTFDTPINARFARGIDWHEANRICSSAGMFRLTFK